jgi:glutathione S-transferase
VLRRGHGDVSGVYTIYGGLGSPYSMKMRAILRYRRLPYIWRQMEMGDDRVFKNVKAPVIPVIQYPDGTWHNDSTPMIFALEKAHHERSIVPTDPATAFIAYLLEDFADEWGTKAMFHYRWFRERDQKQMSEWLAFDRLRGHGRETVLNAASAFRARQVGRMALVGCTKENAPIIEGSTRRILSLFEALVTEQSYLFGSRPSLADFGWFGQLSQLGTDPTPQEMMRRDFPFTYRWLLNIDDASGNEGAWRRPDAPQPDAVKGLLKLAGEIYFPFLIANADAVAKGAETFTVTLLGQNYSQGAFKYQVKCLAELRAAYAKLDAAAKAKIDSLLDETGCLAPLKG